MVTVLLIQLHPSLMLLKEEISCSVKCRSLLSEATVTNESLSKHVPLGSVWSPNPVGNLPDTQRIWNTIERQKSKTLQPRQLCFVLSQGGKMVDLDD